MMHARLRLCAPQCAPDCAHRAASPRITHGRISGSLLNHVLFAASVLALCVSQLVAPSTLHAQFNGPSSLGTTEINRPVTVTTDQSILYPPVQDLVLTPGDVIQIHLFSDADYVPTVRISLDGDALLPLIGVVHLAGLTVTKAEQLIAERLVAEQMYRDPQVLLQITEGPNSVVTVIGELHGVVPVAGSRRLLDVLSAAGGLPATASHVITINRPGVAKPIVIDLGSDPLNSDLGNIPVFRGDTIVVSRVGIVYVLGSFTKDGIIPLDAYAPLTLTEVTSLSGGINFDGRFNDLRIIRTVGNRRTVAVYDIKKVLNGKVPDPILEPNDIVYLPPVPLKTLLSSGGLGTVLGLASIVLSVTR